MGKRAKVLLKFIINFFSDLSTRSVGEPCALSIPNIVYIMRKELEPEKIREILHKLLLIFSVADLKADDLKKAADLRPADYEDAVQSACASRIRADYIVTRNIRDFAGSKVTAIKPSELLERL